MNLIEFKDYPSTETPLNAENLNHNFNEFKPYVLYDNPSGSNGTITLNDTLENYSRIDIYYKDSWGFCSFTSLAKLYNGIAGTLSINRIVPSSSSMWVQSTLVRLNKNTITPDNDYTGTFVSWNNTIESGNPNYIYKVVGYK